MKTAGCQFRCGERSYFFDLFACSGFALAISSSRSHVGTNMALITEGAATFGVLKSAYEFVRDLRKSSDPATLKAGVEELTDRLLAAREDALKMAEQFDTVVEENKKLRSELSKRQGWEAEASRYQLMEIYPGSFAYVLRADKQGTEAPHKACAACFKSEKISILQKADSVHLKCSACGTNIQFQESKNHAYTARIPRGGSWMGS